MKFLLIPLFLAVAALVGLFVLARLSAVEPDGLGVANGRLADCPERDNCVSSQASAPARRVESIPANGPVEAVMARLEQAVNSMDGGQVIEVRGGYLHAVFTSRLWRFRDDLECLYDPAGGRIEVRSASRVGYSDMGANRARVERLRVAMAGR